MNLSTLWELGHNFAQFLRTHPKTADESRLARLAQIDFAELRVSTTAERIASADLPSLDFEKSSIRRSPHIEILEHGDDHRPRVIFKKQGEVENEILSPTEYLILKGLDPAIPLSQFSERLDRAGFGNPEKVQKTLTHWIRSHWVEIQSGERK